MAKILDVAELNGCSVLFLDRNPPTSGWKMITVDGEQYDPVPVYDIEGVVAVRGIGFSVGQEVGFV